LGYCWHALQQPLHKYLIPATCDGTSPAETEDFVDGCDIPAWDTWVYWGTDYNEKRIIPYVQIEYLISWVPCLLHKGMHEAELANATGALSWIENGLSRDYTFSKILEEAGYFFTPED